MRPLTQPGAKKVLDFASDQHSAESRHLQDLEFFNTIPLVSRRSGTEQCKKLQVERDRLIHQFATQKHRARQELAGLKEGPAEAGPDNRERIVSR